MALDILRYLSSHPHAQDTLEGIVEWWLLQQRIENTLRAARAAIAKLLAEKLIVCRSGRDGRQYYKVNRGKSERIQQLLADHLAETTREEE